MNDLLKKINGLFKYAMIPLWVMIFGATHVVFNIGSFYNRLFIDNIWTHLFSIGFILITVLIIILKFCKFKISSLEKVFKKYFLLLIILVLVLLIGSILLVQFNILKPYLTTLLLFVVMLFILISVLYNHEREVHPNLQYTTSFNKTLSMLFYGLIISFFINIFYINTEYKEYLEQYEHLGHIWHHTEKLENFTKEENGIYTYDDKDKTHYKFGYQIDLENVTEKDSTSSSKYKIELESILKDSKENKKVKDWHSLYGYDKKYHGNYDYYEKIKRAIYQPLSDDIEVTIDKYFFEELQNVYFFKHVGKNKYEKSPLPVLKKINLNGISLITMPSVLFINTFLSLIVAVLLQVFLHKAKFLKGGGGH